jgi:hypothetical protein
MKNKEFDMHGWLRQQWLKEQDIKEEAQPLNEEYIEIIRDLDEGLSLILDGWKEWKNGPATERSDIKPAQKELMQYINSWMKKNIK